MRSWVRFPHPAPQHCDPSAEAPTGFTFNQFLLDDDEPLLFHTGHRSMFPAVREAIDRIVPVERLRWITFGHVESDECGAMRVRHIDTPHVPHGWEARVLYEETTGTLLCGDLFTHLGGWPALTEHDVVGAAVEAEDVFGYASLNPSTPSIIGQLAELKPSTLAVMHGSSFTDDGASALRDLAGEYRRRIASAEPNDLAAAVTT